MATSATTTAVERGAAWISASATPSGRTDGGALRPLRDRARAAWTPAVPTTAGGAARRASRRANALCAIREPRSAREERRVIDGTVPVDYRWLAEALGLVRGGRRDIDADPERARRRLDELEGHLEDVMARLEEHGTERLP